MEIYTLLEWISSSSAEVVKGESPENATNTDDARAFQRRGIHNKESSLLLYNRLEGLDREPRRQIRN